MKITTLPMTRKTFHRQFFVVTLTVALLKFTSTQAQNLYFLNAASGSIYQVTPSGVASVYPFSDGVGTGFPIPIAVDSAGVSLSSLSEAAISSK